MARSMLFVCLVSAASGMLVQPALRPSPALARALRPSPALERASTPRMDGFMTDAEKESFIGCVKGGALDWKGVALASTASYLWYLGTNTGTNKDREVVEGPGVRRRALLVVLLLQVPVALGRSEGGKVCTPEENKQRTIDVLKRKGFDTDKIRF